MDKTQTVFSAVRLVTSGQRIFVHGAAMTPTPLIEALCSRDDLQDLEFIHLHTEGPAPYTSKAGATRFKTRALFVGGNVRDAIAEGGADYVPIFLSDIPGAFRSGTLPIDVALLQMSPPDKHGFCSLGTSVDIALAAAEVAKIRIALINPRVPRTHGESCIHYSRITAAVNIDRALYTHEPEKDDPVATAIAHQVAGLVEDGATLQLGIGAIPEAVLRALHTHRRLGLHTEMFSDGIIHLVKCGALTGEAKKVLPGKLVSTFVMGTQELYSFIDDNPLVEMRECSFTNDTAVIRKNPRVTAINSAIEVDLTGQVCADSIGTRQYSGVGGQMDFIRGAALSEGGKAIIALPSRTSRGKSKIVGMLQPGAAVTTTRAHVRFIVTEHGVADLFGKSLRERAKLLISISDPRDRDQLTQEATLRGLLL
jgi:acyl-CoA hydrolase